MLPILGAFAILTVVYFLIAEAVDMAIQLWIRR
jgi:hypothetical protein